MLRIADNTELHLDPIQNSAVAIKRGTGEFFRFECDSAGESLLEKLRSGQGKTDPRSLSQAELEAVEALLDLEILTTRPDPNLVDPHRSQLRWFEDQKMNPYHSQARLENSRVGIIGLGATGAWVALQLCMMGVRHFTLIDPDRIEESNLVRQPFLPSQQGFFKTQALSEILISYRPETQIQTSELLVRQGSEVFPLLDGHDLILIAADHPSRMEAGSILGSACWKRGIPHIVCGGYAGHGGSLGVSLIPGKTPCWDCYLLTVDKKTRELHPADQLIAQGPINPAGFLPTVLFSAAASAHEAIRLLIGKGPQAAGTHRDLWTDSWRITEIPFSRSTECTTCGG